MILDVVTFDSTVSALTGQGTELLIELSKSVGATTYLSGGGATGYLDTAAFSGSGISLRIHDFVHPTYQQLRSDVFVPGLSIIDALFNAPLESIRGWVRGQ